MKFTIYTPFVEYNANVSYTENTRLKIKMHIESFPYKFSLYSTREIHYLDSKLTVKSIFELFIKKCPEFDKVVKYEFY